MERTLTTAQPGHRPILLAELVRAGEPVMLTEFGGTTYDEDQEDSWNGYGDAESPEILLAGTSSWSRPCWRAPWWRVSAGPSSPTPARSGNGLLTQDRVPKLDVAVVRATNQKVSAAVPADAIPAAALGTDGVGALMEAAERLD
jgi:hypothetical protein